MLYNAYELQRLWFAGASAWADASAEWLNNPSNPLSYSAMGPLVASALDVFAHASAPRGKPAFGFTSVMVGGEVYPVEEEVVLRKPFGQLKHFRRVGAPGGDPKVLIVAPISGHFATLLRGMVERMLPGQSSEERRVGKERVRTCRSRWLP